MVSPHLLLGRQLCKRHTDRLLLAYLHADGGSVVQSFELARVLEGEKALRGEVARRKATVDRHLSQAQTCADSASAAALEAEQSELNAQLQKHSNQAHIYRYRSIA